MAADGKSLTGELARYWSAVRYEDLPPDTIHAAKRFLLDTVAAGIAGVETDVALATIKGASAALGGMSGPSVIWGGAQSLPPAQAAMVNGTSAHALELDDFGNGHVGAVVIPAVSAVADVLGSSGKDVLLAIVGGYDNMARVLHGTGGYGPHNDRGWHSSATVGSFGAAAGVASLMKLDAEGYANALGIGGTFTGGIWAFLVDGAMTKRFHPGKAAETGVSAAYLAQAGMTGPRYVLEAEWGGFFSTYAGADATPEAVLRRLGEDFKILMSGIKPYASCRGIHAPLDALFELKTEYGFEADAIAAMVVHCTESNRRMVGGRQVENLLDAQMSLPYSLAVGAQSGRGTLDQYNPPRKSALIDRLMRDTELVPDRDRSQSTGLEIRLKDGRLLQREIAIAKGAAENPLSDKELEAKAASLIVSKLGEKRFAEIVATIASLETLDDFRGLTRLLRPEA